MLVGFVVAVATLVFIVLWGVTRAVSARIERELAPHLSVRMPPSMAASPDLRPRPLIVTVLGWATVAHGWLNGLLLAAFWLWLLSAGPLDWQAPVILGLFPLLSAAGSWWWSRAFMALRAGGREAVLQRVGLPALTMFLAALVVAASLVHPVFAGVVRETGGWTSPEALRAYGWAFLWMVSTLIVVIFSTVITHGLQSEEVRRLFPEGQVAAMPQGLRPPA